MSNSPLIHADATPQSLRVWSLRLPMRIPFSHGATAHHYVESLLFRITSKGGARGYGESLIRTRFTGETLPELVTYLRDTAWPLVCAGFRDRHYRDCLTQIAVLGDKARLPAATCGLDLALLDMLSLTTGKTIRSLLDIYESFEAEPVAPVGLDTGVGASIRARLLLLLGYVSFKLKVSPQSSPASLRNLASALRSTSVVIDGNQCLSEKHAAELTSAAISYFGSKGGAPFPSLHLEDMGAETTLHDEGLVSREDGDRLLRESSESAWNIRVGKNGGLTNALALVQKALSNNVSVYVGSLVGQGPILTTASHLLRQSCAHFGFEPSFWQVATHQPHCTRRRSSRHSLLGRRKPELGWGWIYNDSWLDAKAARVLDLHT